MTPEEAREIDRLEFEADCRAVRERAYEVIAQRHQTERDRLQHWIGHDQPVPNFIIRHTVKPTRQPIEAQSTSGKVRVHAATTYTVNGRTMNVRLWAAHLGLTTNALHQRAWKLQSMEAAIRMGRTKRGKRGVDKNLPVLEGTGGGSITQDISKIEFFQ